MEMSEFKWQLWAATQHQGCRRGAASSGDETMHDLGAQGFSISDEKRAILASFHLDHTRPSSALTCTAHIPLVLRSERCWAFRRITVTC